MEKKEMVAESEVKLGKEKEIAAVEEGKLADGALEKEAVSKEAAPVDAAPEVILQYRDYEVNMEAVIDRIKSHYFAKGHTAGSIESMQVYVKPEDFTAYYVINDGVVGKVGLF